MGYSWGASYVRTLLPTLKWGLWAISVIQWFVGKKKVGKEYLFSI